MVWLLFVVEVSPHVVTEAGTLQRRSSSGVFQGIGGFIFEIVGFVFSLFHRNDKSLLHPVDIFIKIERTELSSQLQRHHEDLTTARYLIFETELSLFFIQITPFLFSTRRITAIALLIHFRAIESMVLWHCYQHKSHLLGHKDCLFCPRLCLHLFLSLINPTDLYEN